MSELIDISDLNKRSEEYPAFVLLNQIIRKRTKNEPKPESRARIDEAVRIARAHNYSYLNEDGDFTCDLAGNPVTEEITPLTSMIYAFSLIPLTLEEKMEVKNSFIGA